MSLSRTPDPGQSKDNPVYSELIKDELSVFCGKGDGKGDKKRKSYCDIQGNNAQCHCHEPLILVRARTIQFIQN